MELRHEFPSAHAAVICACEDFAAGFYAGGREVEEAGIVFFNPEDLAFVIAGEGRRVEDDDVKLTTLFGKAAEPMEGIAFAKIVVLWSHAIEAEVFASPVEVDLGKVQSGRYRSRGGGCDGEKSGVCKSIKNGVARFHDGTKGGTVVPLIEEDSLGVSRLERESAFEFVFDPGEILRHFGATDVDRRFFLMLIEAFPVKGFPKSCQNVSKFLVETGASG